MGQPSWDQDSFRGRNDDGSESAATWKADPNIGWTQDTDENFRVRFLVQNAGDKSGDIDAKLQYNRNSTGWYDVTTTSNVVKSTLSDYFADEDTAYQRLGSGSFVNGKMDEASGVTSAITVGIGYETEFEFCAQIVGTDVNDEDTIELQLVKSGSGAYDSYTNTPSITVNKAATVVYGSGVSKHVSGGVGSGFQLSYGSSVSSSVAFATGSGVRAVNGSGVCTNVSKGTGTSLVTVMGSGVGQGVSVGTGSSQLTIFGSGASKSTSQGIGQPFLIISGSGVGSGVGKGLGSGARVVFGSGIGWSVVRAASIPSLTIQGIGRAWGAGLGLGSGIIVVPPATIYGVGVAFGVSHGHGKGYILYIPSRLALSDDVVTSILTTLTSVDPPE